MAPPRALASLSELEDRSARNMASVFSMSPKRHFKVVVKSGTTRSVHPYLDFSFMPRDKKMVQFLSKLNNKRSNSQQH